MLDMREGEVGGAGDHGKVSIDRLREEDYAMIMREGRKFDN